MDRSAGIDIALATYQGERFLPEQLASIAAQTLPAARVVVRDDGSNDASLASIDKAARAGLPVTMLDHHGERLGPSANFSRILAATSAPYVALCDQDDRWDGGKLERLQAEMARAEAASPRGTSILVCSDLRLIDAAGTPLASSYWRHQGYVHQRASRFASLLVMNCFPGCSMMANRALLERAIPVPAGAVMHDWWLAQVAAAVGRLVIVPEPLMDYRLHGQNAIGVPAASFAASVRAIRGGGGKGVRSALLEAVAQARELRMRLGALPDADARTLLDAFCEIEGHGWIGRRWTLVRHGIGKHGILRQVNLLLRA